MVEPGFILKTAGKVPLRFVVMAVDEDNDQMYLYCTARHKAIETSISEFFKLEDPMVMKMTLQKIEDEINPYAASIAQDARKEYLGTGKV